MTTDFAHGLRRLLPSVDNKPHHHKGSAVCALFIRNEKVAGSSPARGSPHYKRESAMATGLTIAIVLPFLDFPSQI